jgi:hypothetical protein
VIEYCFWEWFDQDELWLVIEGLFGTADKKTISVRI